jgi:hypothetical protein
MAPAQQSTNAAVAAVSFASIIISLVLEPERLVAEYWMQAAAKRFPEIVVSVVVVVVGRIRRSRNPPIGFAAGNDGGALRFANAPYED